MPRKLAIVAAAIVALHIIEILTLGTTPHGSLLANLLEILASGIAAAMALSAARRGRGLSRSFWILVASGAFTWGFANLGWTYYEFVLAAEPPPLSFVRFLFDIQGAFFLMALFLDEDKDSTRLDFASLLDFLQIAIIYYFIYVGLYYVPSLSLDTHSALTREFLVMVPEDLIILALAFARAWYARSEETRRLYRGLAMYLLVYTCGALFADYMQYLHETATGTILDMAWTLPMLFAAFWAVSWKPGSERKVPSTARTRSFSGMLLRNAAFAAAPLIVLFLSAGLGSQWRVMRYSLLAVSVLCYAARMAISDYRQTKNAELVRRQMHAMDSSADGMAIVDTDGHYLYVNSEYARMAGKSSPDLMMGKHWSEAANPADTRRWEKEIREGLARSGKWFGEMVMHTQDGRSLPVEMAVTALAEGGVVCVNRDLTERVRAERAREEAESKFRMIVEQVAAISYIAELGVDGVWHYVSPQIESILGYSQEEWITNSKEWIQYVVPEDHQIVREAEEACIKGQAFQAEYRMTRKDGRVVWVSDSAVVVRGSEAHPVMEGIIVDITERKQLEGQLQQSRRMEAVGRLAGGIAHDFNNLLTIIKGYTELALQRGDAGPRVRTDIERIEDASERAAALVRQLLAFSRKQVLQPKNLDLSEIVLSLDKLLRRLIGEDIAMKTVVGKNLGTIKADPAQVEQVLMNLVVNARDAMPGGGKLMIETSNVELDKVYASEHVSVKPGRYVMLAVSDTGVGMNAETVAHIFEPFFTTKGGTKGTGLGLATAYGIVKQSGGYIWVYSEPGEGSSFKVYFPRVEEAAEKSASVAEELGASRGTETILLVEDDEAVRELTEVILETQGYKVICADGPIRAEEISAKRSREIDLVLTDVIMPEMSGRELVRKLSEVNPKLKVLYMSGYTDNVIAQGGVLEAGLAFLQKPFTPRALARKVREVLDATVPVR
jgi:PAS domain S-box-containing protein